MRVYLQKVQAQGLMLTNGLADMLANLIEKYASVLDIENLPDMATDHHVE